MALVACPECKGNISDRAKRCVHCGCSIGDSNDSNADDWAWDQASADEGKKELADKSDGDEVKDESNGPLHNENRPGSFESLVKKASDKVASCSKLFKGAIVVVAFIVAVFVLYLAIEPPFVGKWYPVGSPESFIEIKRDGSVVVSDGAFRSDASRGVDVSWTELEKNVAIIDVKYFDNSGVNRDSIVVNYGKTTDGIEYLESDDFLAYKKYEDALKA